MKTEQIFLEDDERVLSDFYIGATELYYSEKRLYVLNSSDSARSTEVVDRKTINDVQVVEQRLKRNAAWLICGLLITVFAVLVKLVPILKQFTSFLFIPFIVVGPVLAIIGIICLIPKYSTKIFIHTTGITIEIPADKIDKKQLTEIRAQVFGVMVVGGVYHFHTFRKDQPDEPKIERVRPDRKPTVASTGTTYTEPAPEVKKEAPATEPVKAKEEAPANEPVKAKEEAPAPVREEVTAPAAEAKEEATIEAKAEAAPAKEEAPTEVKEVAESEVVSEEATIEAKEESAEPAEVKEEAPATEPVKVKEEAPATEPEKAENQEPATV